MGQSGKSSSQVFDVIVLGSGPIGATLAWKLAADGYRVCVCDEYQQGLRLFRAEHLSQQAVSLYRDLGLFERIKPLLSPLDYTANFRNGRLLQITSEEDYAVSYERLVNTLRLGLERVATLHREKVVRVSARGRVKSVRLESGVVICGWMVVVTTEGGAGIQTFPELKEEILGRDHSLSFAWNLEVGDSARMRYPALVFRSSRMAHGYEHLRVFRTQEELRANFFTFWGAGDERRRDMTSGKAESVLTGNVEGLFEYLNDFCITSGVEESVGHLTRIHGGAESGLVLVGNACGEVAPFGEMNLCKGLNDVKVLASLAPQWLRDRQLTAEVLVEYEAHPAKRSFDERAYDRSCYAQRLATDRSAEWMARRLKGDYVPAWLQTACLRGIEGGRWTLENVGLPAWRRGVELARNYRESRGKQTTGNRSGELIATRHDDLAGADGFDDLVS